MLHSDIDLLNPPAELEKQKHKLKRLVQSPNSFFMVRTPLGADTERETGSSTRSSRLRYFGCARLQ